MPKRYLFFLGVVCPLAAQSVIETPLNPRQPVDIAVSREITTLLFPGTITAVAAADMLIDAGKGDTDVEEGRPLRFHVTHAPGSTFILVRSLKAGANGRLTTIFDGSAYVLNLRSVDTDSTASVIFQKPAPPPPAVRVEAPPPPVPFSPRIGLSLLDRARAYPVLAASVPHAVEGVTLRVQNRSIVLPDVEIFLQEVYRFSREDAVVFLLRIRNITDATVDLVPSTFAARVRDERFEAAIANGPRSLAPGASDGAEFAIVGLPDGTRNDLSADNAFTILVDTARRCVPAITAISVADGDPTP